MMKTTNSSVTFAKSNSNDSFEFVEILNGNRESDDQDHERRPSLSFEFVGSRPDNNDDNDCNEKPNFTPLNAQTLQTFFDADGRLTHELKLREALFHGGCEADIRRTVWSFIFGLYPMTSTKRERKELDIENHFRYHALKYRCSDLLQSNDCGISDGPIDDLPSMDCELTNTDIDQTTIDNHKAMARIYAGKQTCDLTMVGDWYRVIDKDIPRTDIDHPYFRNFGDECLVLMKNILVTFGFFHPEIGYVQGMNDILTRFMIVLDSEVDAYWCFAKYMERVENDFDEDGMVEKIDQVRSLLQDLEPNLFSHFCNCSVPDLVFCHRWLLVSFKREFDYDESIRYFEIAQSQHLKFDSDAALSTQDEQYRLELMKNKGKGGHKSSPDFAEVKYTLEVFVCVSVIMLKRQEFLACTDAAEVFHVACNIRGTLNLEEVHQKAFNLFFKYCRKYVKDKCAKEDKNIFHSLAKSFQSISWKWK